VAAIVRGLLQNDQCLSLCLSRNLLVGGLPLTPAEIPLRIKQRCLPAFASHSW
jgi:hypothetical protein